MNPPSQPNVIFINGARLAFPNLIEAVPYQGGEPRFSADLILSSNDPAIGGIMNSIGAMANTVWKEYAQAVLQNCQNNRKLRCWGDGSEKINQTSFQVYDGYGPGTFFLSAASRADQPPKMIRADGTEIDNSNSMERMAAARKLYGGCYVDAMIFFWPQDNKHGKAVRCQLVAIQFDKDGPAFGAQLPDTSGFFKAKQDAPQQPFGMPQYGAPPQPQFGQNPYQPQPQQPQFGQQPQAPQFQNSPGVKMPWEY